MEPVSGSRTDRDATRLHLAAAREALRSLDELSVPDGATLAGKTVSRHVSIALNELREVDQQIAQQIAADSHASAGTPRVPCSFCGRMIIPTASLCGYCWRRPIEPATAAPAMHTS